MEWKGAHVGWMAWLLTLFLLGSDARDQKAPLLQEGLVPIHINSPWVVALNWNHSWAGADDNRVASMDWVVIQACAVDESLRGDLERGRLHDAVTKYPPPPATQVEPHSLSQETELFSEQLHAIL